MASNIKNLLRSLVRDFDAQDEAAADLWSWLPSYASAQKHYGDYACEHQPSLADLMREATLVFSASKGNEQSASEMVDWFYIDTDGFHEDTVTPSREEKLAFVKAWFAERKMTLSIKGPLGLAP